MLNIVIPLAGVNRYFPREEYPFPTPLIEVCGMSMIEAVVRNLSMIEGDKRFIFILNQEECAAYSLDRIVKLLAGEKTEVVKLAGQAKGAACSVLTAIDHIENDDPLLIANCDQLFEVNVNDLVKELQAYDGGTVTFSNIHPRWSYVRVDETGLICEAAEKVPISNNALAGLYYFAKGKEFVSSCMDMIASGKSLNDVYYIAPVFNEMILAHKKIGHVTIQSRKFHSFYLPTKIAEFEKRFGTKRLKDAFSDFLKED